MSQYFKTFNEQVADTELTARQTLEEQLSLLLIDWQNKFKWMYGRDKGRRSLEESTAMSIADVIKEMPTDKLDWAMNQVRNSLKKLEAR